MTTTKIAGLIERLEMAKGPDRELADDVLLASGWRLNFNADEIEDVRKNGWKCEAENGEEYTDTFAEFMKFACWYPPGSKPFRDKWIHGHVRPDPISSLDAAMSLVPEGWLFGSLVQLYAQPECQWVAVMWTSDGLCRVEAVSVRPAISTATCALKARQALSSSQKGESNG